MLKHFCTTNNLIHHASQTSVESACIRFPYKILIIPELRWKVIYEGIALLKKVLASLSLCFTMYSDYCSFGYVKSKGFESPLR